MTFADYVLERTLTTQGLSHLVWTGLRRLVIAVFRDPPCTLQTHGRLLRLPLSHELPTYLRLLPFYDSLPGRLSAYLHGRYGPLKCLDVGANIGDTIAALYRDGSDRFLAVEPEPSFRRYLQENWHAPTVEVVGAVCAAASATGRFQITARSGTASLYQNARGVNLPTITVDDLLAAHPEFAGLHLIKIDTDGNDFDVLCGAQRSLAAQPAVLFESDVFGNRHYVEDCMDAMARFRRAGYESFLLYEKFGYPMGRYELDDLDQFKELLFYQLTKRYIYFDILLMREPDLQAFHAIESSFFLDTLWDPRLRATAERTRTAD